MREKIKSCVFIIISTVIVFSAENPQPGPAENAKTTVTLPQTTVGPRSAPLPAATVDPNASVFPISRVTPQPVVHPGAITALQNVKMPTTSVAPQSIAQSDPPPVPLPQEGDAPHPMPLPPAAIDRQSAGQSTGSIAPQAALREPLSYAEDDTCNGSEFHFGWTILNDTIKEFRKSMKLDLQPMVVTRPDGKREVRVHSPCQWVQVDNINSAVIEDSTTQAPPPKKESFWRSKLMVGAYCVLAGALAVAVMK